MTANWRRAWAPQLDPTPAASIPNRNGFNFQPVFIPFNQLLGTILDCGFKEFCPL